MKEESHSGWGSQITRREFIKYSAGASMMLGMPGLWAGCSDSDSPPPQPGTEHKTFYFDLSHGNPRMEYYLVAGKTRHAIATATPDMRQQARAVIPALQSVPDARITHAVEGIPLSSTTLHLLYVVGRDPSAIDRSWTLPLFFFHLPERSLRYAWETMRRLYPGLSALPAIKFNLYGLKVLRDKEEDYVRQHDFKNTTDQAVAMVFHHPEMLCFDSDSGAHIQQTHIATQPTTAAMASQIQAQGEATESGGWATLVPVIDPDTGQPYLNSHGEKVFTTKWSDQTCIAAGHAVTPPLTQSKSDPTLGCNLTNLDPEAENLEVKGKVWSVYDGLATVNAGSVSGPRTAFKYTMPDQSRHQGYQVKLTDVTSDRKVSIQVKNWFGRYLGLYIRFLDAGGNVIAVKDLPSSTTDDFPSQFSKWDGDKDKFAAFVQSDYVYFGIPFYHSTTNFSFHMPENAAKALILAGGSGSGSNPYPDTVELGDVPTVILNLAIPGIFLLCNTPTGYVQLLSGLEAFQVLQLVMDLVAAGILDILVASMYKDPKCLANLAQVVGTYLLMKSLAWFKNKIAAAAAEGEVEDSIPIVGTILYLLASAALVAEISETIAVIANCPQTYKNTLTFTHDITVTILPDVNHPKIFPETATTYQVIAQFDSGTPVKSGRIEIPIPSPEQIVYTFQGAPYGGHVNISVGFYSDTDWLAGNGSTGSIQNTVSNVQFHITEHEVPITIETQYSHKQKTALDENENRIWTASGPPSVVPLSCRDEAGQLCLLTGMTISQQFESAGYSWQSYSPDVRGCETGQQGQFHQFASMAITTVPQVGYGAAACGFISPVHLAYDLIGKGNDNYYLDNTNNQRLVRQIRLALDGPPQIDGPDSNRAWGKFNNPVDALLLHPSRKLVSISAQFNKIEVLDLPDEAVADQDAPLAQAYSGYGTREGLVNGLAAAAIAPDGAILVLESGSRRIQAFDVGINPVPKFQGAAYYIDLKEETEAVTYLDLSVEFTGYIYVLSRTGSGVHRLDIYSPQGEFLSRTMGVNAGRFTVDFWRNVFTLNYECLILPKAGITEPSVSLWIPSTPK